MSQPASTEEQILEALREILSLLQTISEESTEMRRTLEGISSQLDAANPR